MKRRAAGGVGAHVGEHGAEGGVDRGAAGHALGHVGRRMEDGGGVGKGGAKRLPLEILECGQEATQRGGDGCRVAAGGGTRLGTDDQRKGERSDRGKDGRRAERAPSTAIR